MSCAGYVKAPGTGMLRSCGQHPYPPPTFCSHVLNKVMVLALNGLWAHLRSNLPAMVLLESMMASRFCHMLDSHYLWICPFWDPCSCSCGLNKCGDFNYCSHWLDKSEGGEEIRYGLEPCFCLLLEAVRWPYVLSQTTLFLQGAVKVIPKECFTCC